MIIKFFFLLPHIASASSCGTSKCFNNGVHVKFPFFLTTPKDPRCGYPGFNLTCNPETEQTLITLPSTSGSFSIQTIDYRVPLLSIVESNGDNCLIKRFINNEISLKDSPFIYSNPSNYHYMFYTCSSKAVEALAYYPVISCLGVGGNKTIVVPGLSYLAPAAPKIPDDVCSLVTRASVPVKWGPLDLPNKIDWENINYGFQLTWFEPNCGECETLHGACRLKSAGSSVTTCNAPKHLSAGAKRGLMIGFGIPGLVGVTGLLMLIVDKVRTFHRGNDTAHAELTSTVTNGHLPVVTVVTGLDDATIESYPKIELGESVELPNSSDKTCSICLAEYLEKEMVRIIPECNHYFHAKCIDEWLRKNATCPICRKTSTC